MRYVGSACFRLSDWSISATFSSCYFLFSSNSVSLRARFNIRLWNLCNKFQILLLLLFLNAKEKQIKQNTAFMYVMDSINWSGALSIKKNRNGWCWNVSFGYFSSNNDFALFKFIFKFKDQFDYFNCWFRLFLACGFLHCKFSTIWKMERKKNNSINE